MTATAWAKWFWSDWVSDPNLRVCSYAARGLWIDMLAIAAAAGGYVEVNGRPLTSIEIARATAGAPEEVVTLLEELERNRVFSRDKRGCIYSRRITRDENRRRISVENGKKGGNPRLYKQKEISDRDKGRPNPPIPDTRIQRPEKKVEEEPALALSGGASLPSDGWPSDAWAQFWKAYPHKVGIGDAQKAFAKVRRTGVPWDRFWSGLTRYVRKTDDRPWCNPSTWLNQRRWEDDPAPPPNGGNRGHHYPEQNHHQKVTPAMLARGDYGRTTNGK